MNNSQILEMHATSIRRLLKEGIRTEFDEKEVCYHINKLKDMSELMNCHQYMEDNKAIKDLLEEADDALVTWQNCQNHIERNPCYGCTSQCWGC